LEEELSRTMKLYQESKTDKELIDKLKERTMEIQISFNQKVQENELLMEKLNAFINSQESIFRENRIQILEEKIKKLIEELEDWKTRYEYIQNIILQKLNGTNEIDNLKEVYENKVALLATEINRLNQLLKMNDEMYGKWKANMRI
jgi:hypothetical protein